MNQVYEIKSSDGRVMKVYEDRLVLTQKGLLGFVSRGLAGEKTIYYRDLSSVQFKNCGFVAGFMEFTFPGSNDHVGGPISGTANENRFTFGRPTIGAAKKLARQMEEVNNYIQGRIGMSRQPRERIASLSAADEIVKFKQLLEEGIITQGEFELKKKELLNL